MDATGLRKSKRIAKKSGGGNFKNTRDNPLGVNDDENELAISTEVAIEEGSAIVKRKKAPLNVAKEKKGKKARKKAPTSIRLRTTPNPLFKAVRSLSTEQEECLIEMGFGGLLRMKLDGIPSTLGLHVARNFDPYSLTIKTSNGPIKITTQAINDMIGAPMGHISYDTCSTDDHGAAIKAEWIKQFSRETIRATDVSRQIVLSNDADWNFMLNFIVVFCNTMGSCKYNGLCDLTMLSRVTKDTKFQDINWCEYILTCLEYCKNNWSGNDESEFFCGPLTTLVLLYVDNIKCSVPQVLRVRPAIKAWSYDLLKMRMEAELELGGLGLGQFNEPYNMMIPLPPASPDNVEGYLSKVDEAYEKMISFKTTIIMTLQKASSKFPGSSNLEEWRQKHIDVFVSEKENDETEERNVEDNNDLHAEDLTIDNTITMDETIATEGQEVVIERRNVQNQNQIEEDNPQEQMVLDGGDFSINNAADIREGVQDDFETDTQFFEDPGVIQSCDIAQSEAEKKKNDMEAAMAEKNMDESDVTPTVNKENNRSEKAFGTRRPPLSPSPPSFSLGLTQEFGEDTSINTERDEDGGTTIPGERIEHDTIVPMDVTMTEKVVTNIPKEPEHTKAGLTVKLKLNKEKLKVIQTDCETPANQNKGQTMENEGQKRGIKAALPICSPYLNRKVDANATLTKDETLVGNWMFAMKGDKMDGVFKAFDGAEAPKVVFESMAPKTAICASVIDIWSYILNREEELRDRASPHRLYCTTTTMSYDMLPPKMSTNAMVTCFSSSLKAAMTNVEEMASLRNVDMIFFPISCPGHFYLIVFNLKNPSFVILDNSATNVTIAEKYGDLPDMLKLALVEYLKDVKHPRVNSMTKVKPNRYKMKWRTLENKIDCGIFVMRHMETYKGETVGRYDCGFDKEFGSQDSQIKKIRSKYLCKMLLSTHNTLRDKVVSQATTFSNIEGKITKKMVQDAMKTKESRLA